MSAFEQLLKERPHDLLLPDESIKLSSLRAVKSLLDPLASKYSIFNDLHIEGLDAELVWAQARMIIDGAVDKLLESEIPPLLNEKEQIVGGGLEMESMSGSELDGNDSSEEDFETKAEEADQIGKDIDNADYGVNEYEDLENEYEEDDMEIDPSQEEISQEEDEEYDEDQDDEEEDQDDEEEDQDEELHPELDKGLFRLKDFQKQILDLEKQPEEDDNINYFAEQPAEDSDGSEMAGDNLRFEDFFARPRKMKEKRSKNKKLNVDDKYNDVDFDDEEQLEQAMSTVRKDLFGDDNDDEYTNEGNKENLSTFERQQQEIVKQIHELEQENIAEKEWQVRGEVKAKSRPLDSLIETDLDFERTSKPVPIITEEVTQSLEDMIRKRIKNFEFDDLPRRLPDSLPEFKPSRKVELQETKSQKSLAELYEEDHLKKENPDLYKQAEDEKMNEAHKEIIDLFASVSRKLDSLSSWNFTPKAPKPSISIVTNTSAISMEEAQPVALSSENTLGPQEVYSASTSSKRELVGPDGLPVSKNEMSREERNRARRRAKAKRGKILRKKEEIQKAKAQKDNSQAAVLETLKKANVTVIGKKGEKRDISGNLKKDQNSLVASNLKL